MWSSWTRFRWLRFLRYMSLPHMRTNLLLSSVILSNFHPLSRRKQTMRKNGLAEICSRCVAYHFLEPTLVNAIVSCSPNRHVCIRTSPILFDNMFTEDC